MAIENLPFKEGIHDNGPVFHGKVLNYQMGSFHQNPVG
jgi:hypothetical protein